MISRIQHFDYYKKKDLEALENQKKSQMENLYKKVKLYQSKANSSSYKVPHDLEHLVQIADDTELRAKIEEQIDEFQVHLYKELQRKHSHTEGRELPDFLNDPLIGHINASRLNWMNWQILKYLNK